MIRDSAKKIFDTVLVWKLDRFSRDRIDSALYKQTLKKNGVKVISIKEPIAEGSAGILFESMLEGYAEYYSVELGEKVRRGLKENALKAKANGGCRTFGYYIDNDRHYQIEVTTAPIVREIFAFYANGMTMKNISKMLVARGIKAHNSDEFSHRAIHRILSNRKYIGEYSFGDIVIPNSIPAIIDIDLFDKVQTKLDKNKHAPAHSKAQEEYYLTPKLFCGTCGALLNGESGTSKTGAIYRYYKCNNARKKLCKCKPIKKDIIEAIALNEVMKFLADDAIVNDLINTIFTLQSRENSKLPYLHNELKEVEKKINNLIKAIEDGITTQSTKSRMFELEENKAKLELSIMQEEIKKPLLTKEQIAFGIYQFCNFNLSIEEDKQLLINNFINSIFVHNDKLIIVCKYKEDKIIVPLDNIKPLCTNVNKSSDLMTITPPSTKSDIFLVKDTFGLKILI